MVAFGVPGVTTNEEESEKMAFRTFYVDKDAPAMTQRPVDQDIGETYS